MAAVVGVCGEFVMCKLVYMTRVFCVMYMTKEKKSLVCKRLHFL